MVKIKEIQYEKYNPDNRQQRIIEYPSWLDYIQDIQKEDAMSHMFSPSFPRQTSIMKLKVWDDKLSCEFDHRVIRQRIIHVAELIEGLR